MSGFSFTQCERLVDDFWNQGLVRCPDDGTCLDSHLHDLRTTYLLVLACHQCGKKTQITRFSDPRQHEFRCWTADESREIESAMLSGMKTECPVCQAQVAKLVMYGTPLVLLNCPRCGNEHESDLQSDETVAHSMTFSGERR
jgi:hypothetical protein